MRSGVRCAETIRLLMRVAIVAAENDQTDLYAFFFEKLRKAVIDIAHLEGFNLSAADVTLQRLVSFGIGPLMKAAFDEIFRSPFIARAPLVPAWSMISSNGCTTLN